MVEFSRKNNRVWSMLGMRRIVGQMLNELAEEDASFCFATADVARYFGTEDFEKKYPNRIIDVGIAEQNLVTVAAGMAKEGINIFAATYGTFITARALDQVRVNMGYMQLPIVLIGVGGGLSEGDLSATHMALEDISDLTTIPNITVICPADGFELIKALRALVHYHKPAYLRLTGSTNTDILYNDDFEYKIGQANTLREGNDVAIIGCGNILGNVIRAAKGLSADGIEAKVIDMHTISPLDKSVLDEISSMKLVVTVEEHMKHGGLGGAVAEYYAEKKNRPRLLFIGLDNYPKACEYKYLLEDCGLDEEGIYQSIKNSLNSGEL